MPDNSRRFEKSFLINTAWNYGAFGVMASVGVILNFFIAYWFGVEVLGIFNQVYAIYVVAAQLAVMGLQDSVQKHVAQLDDKPNKIHVVSSAALTLAALSGSVVAVIVYLLSNPIALALDSQAVGKGIALAAPGLLFFGLNKVLMGTLSGARRLKSFAAAQTMRVLVILLACKDLIVREMVHTLLLALQRPARIVLGGFQPPFLLP